MNLTPSMLRAMHREPTLRNANDNPTRAELPNTERIEPAKALAGGSERETPGAGLPVVRFILRRVHLLDWESKYASVKALLDGCRYAGLIHGDRCIARSMDGVRFI